jgi:dTDP-4-dehydrorhamnose reductase
MPPHFLVIGCRGQVGWELMRTLQPLGRVIGVDFPEVDLARPESLRPCLDEARPQAIVNAAAYTAVDRAESEPEAARRLNALAPGFLAEEARRRGAWLVHFSTDYVFDGSARTPYTEEAPPNPLSTYGRTKAEGDAAVQQVGGRHLIFRLCWVYGGRGQNFLRTMLRLATTRDELRVVNDQHGCPTWSRLIAEATAQALARALHAPEPDTLAGVYHLACNGVATWFEFARAIWESVPAEARRAAHVTPITTADYPAPARRPAWSVLDCGKLERVFGLRLPHWRSALRLVLESPVEGFETLALKP